MDKIEIRRFEEKDIQVVAMIVFYAFKSKFHSLKSLSDEKKIQLLIESGFIENQSFEGNLVAEKDGIFVGVILLKWQNQKKMKFFTKFSFTKLCCNYGFANILKFIIYSAILKGTISDGECYIEHIAVNPSYRNQGIGTMLINYTNEKVENIAALNRITLYVSERNVLAIKLYKELGFIIKTREISWISKFFLKEKSWLYMEKFKA